MIFTFQSEQLADIAVIGGRIILFGVIIIAASQIQIAVGLLENIAEIILLIYYTPGLCCVPAYFRCGLIALPSVTAAVEHVVKIIFREDKLAECTKFCPVSGVCIFLYGEKSARQVYYSSDR